MKSENNHHWDQTRLVGSLLAISFLVFNLALPHAKSDSAANLEISEIAYDLPESDTDHEWVEIHNLAVAPVTIITGSGTGSWRFFDTSNHSFTLSQGQTTISANGYAILAQNPSQFVLDYPSFSGTIFKVALSLPNTTATLKLSADKGTSFFHERSYTSSLGAAGDGHTLEWNGTNWQPSFAVGGTPGQPFVQPPSTPSPLPAPAPPTASPAPSSTPTTPVTPAPSPTLTSAPTPTPTVPPQMAVTKIAYNPSGSDPQHEWLELQNIGAVAIPVHAGRSRTDWRIAISGVHHTLTLVQGRPTLYPGDRFVIAADAPTFRQDFPTFSGNLLNSPISLSNQGGIIELSLDGGITWISRQKFHPTDGADGDGRVLNHLPSGQWRADRLADAQPGSQPPATWSSVSAPKIFINEFLPNPDSGETEWIELWNGDTTAIDLTGWRISTNLQPTAAGALRLPANTPPLVPGAYQLVPKSAFHTRLLNDAGELHLFTPNSDRAHSVFYSGGHQGASWIRLRDGGTAWTDTPTPGASNQLVNDQHPVIARVETGDPPPLVTTEDGVVIVDQTEPVTTALQLEELLGQTIELHGTVDRSLGRQAMLTDQRIDQAVTVDFQLPPHTKPAIHRADTLTVTGKLRRDGDRYHLIVSQLAAVTVTPVIKTHHRSSQRSRPRMRSSNREPIRTATPRLAPPPILWQPPAQPVLHTWTIALPLGMLAGIFLVVLLLLTAPGGLLAHGERRGHPWQTHAI